MAAPAETTENGKKRRGSRFKNGLSKLKSKVKKDKSKTEVSKPKKSKESKRNSKKFKAPVMPKLDLSTYTFPKQILPPCESWGTQSYDEEEKKIHTFLSEKYQKEIGASKFFPDDIVIRFTLSQRGMTPFQARQDETEKTFKTYLKYHAEYHYGTCLDNAKTPRSQEEKVREEEFDKEMLKAVPMFIYGQDMEGHPILWDDGSAFHKDADIDSWNNDAGLQKISVFRTRLMKKMHNVKMAASKKYGRMIYKHCMVMDMSCFNSKKFIKERKFHEHNTKEVSDLFPESLHRLYVINTPAAFRGAWKVIKTFLDPVSAEKTKILGKDFIAEMIRDINLDMIPHKFGGIGPWEIRLGDTPEGYSLETTDNDFDYATLPPNELPMPPRAAPPDMNKHKKRRARAEKVLAEKGIDGLDDIDWDDDEDEDEKTDDTPDKSQEKVEQSESISSAQQKSQQ